MAIGHSLRNQCACAHNLPIRPIQVDVTNYLGQNRFGSWDVESAYKNAMHHYRRLIKLAAADCGQDHE